MSERTDFFIVGIGASAGGLEALQEFFSKLPDSNPAAFVIIQHLSPDFKNMMGDLLAKYTKMPIRQVKRATTIKPNHVYLIGPKKNLELIGSTLTPKVYQKTTRPNLPIDLFFKSLGQHHGDNSIGVVLSGTGTDGSQGIKTIKEQGGIVMVQTPKSAKFDGMPNAALLTGLADFELPLVELAREVEKIIHRIPPIAAGPKKIPSSEKDYLDEILKMVSNETQVNFQWYKEATIMRRLQKRMYIKDVDTLQHYHDTLVKNPPEIKQLAHEFLIGVSGFFRDASTWETFRDQAIPQIISSKKNGDTIRVWIAGCSTGEEAYTIGMLIDDYLLKNEPALTYKIFGSDIDQRSIYRAGRGVYTSSNTSTIPTKFLSRYFEKTGDLYKVKKKFRDRFVFAHQNIISDPPFIHMDVVSCRNVLIYLNPEIQQRALINFHFSLNTGGVLVLGKSENLGKLSAFFTSIGKNDNIFRNAVIFNRRSHYKLQPEVFSHTTTTPLPPAYPRHMTELPPNSVNLLINKAQDEAGMLVNSNFQIVHIKGKLEPFIHFSKDDLSPYLEDVMNKEDYFLFKRGILQTLQQKKAIYFEKVLLKRGRTQRLVDLRFNSTQDKLLNQEFVYIEFRNLRTAAVTNQPLSSDQTKDQYILSLEKELEEKKKIIQLLREEVDSHTEKLQTSNEELLASNEELQSSNEELQSVNEELYSVNVELQEKITEVIDINSDIVNLLNHTQIATLFVDRDFLIRRLTPKISDIINISSHDIGRSLDHFANNLDNISLIPLGQQVLSSGETIEKEVSLSSGRSHYLMQILPYHKADGVIDGLVITFVDITEVKKAQIDVQNARSFAENIVNAMANPLLVLDASLKVISANSAYYTTFRTNATKTESRYIYELGNGQWNQPELRQSLENILPKNETMSEYQIEFDIPEVGFHIMMLNAIIIPQTGNIPNLILLSLRDITEEERSRKQMIETTKRLSMVIQSSKIGSWEYNLRTQEVIGDQRLRELFELPLEGRLAFQDLAKRIHPDDYEEVYDSISQAIEKNTTYSADFRIITGNGGVRYLTGYGSMLLTDEGEPYKMLGLNLDITERRRAEENITQYGRLLEESHNEIYIFDAETLHFVNVNRGAQNNLGYSMAEMSTLTPPDIKPEYSAESFAKLIEPLRKGQEESLSFETVHRRKDGTLYNVLSHLQQSTFQDRNVFIAIVQDTTEQTEARKKLREDEERLSFAINATSDGIWDWPDMEREEVWWSPRLYQLLGLQEGEIVPTIPAYQSLVYPSDTEIRRKAFEAHIRDNKPFDITIRMMHKTQGYRWYRSRGQVVRNEAGQPVRMAGVVSDIHNQKLAENKLKKTNRDLRIANEYLDNFVFTAAHDLRAPVANLKSLAGLLGSQTGPDNRVVEKIDQSIDRLEKTLRGLIKILDIQQTDRKEHASISFKKVLQQVLHDLERHIAETGATITYDFKVKTISYVESYLFSIIKNLLSNALKFSNEQRPLQIHIHTTKENSYVCLSISDNGLGINLERYRKKLFKAFERLSRTSTGLGIGLHIVKTIVEKNEGFIEVQSQMDQGTTFLVYLKPYSNEEENITH